MVHVSNISVGNLKVKPYVDVCFDIKSKGAVSCNDKFIPSVIHHYKYDKETGDFTGSKGLIKPCEKGYVILPYEVDGSVKHIRAHRVACYLLGYDISKGEVDHVDGRRSNNKPDNLRIVNRSTNRRNSALSSCNTSGMVGVSWYKHRRCWEVRVCGKAVGYSVDFFEACCIRKRYENKAGGFTVRHGSRKK